MVEFLNYDSAGFRRKAMEKKKEEVIQVRNLYKIYRIGENRVRAFNGVSLNIDRGECW